ncbi:MAG TPA: CAP domain-containing protein, partial [Polyangiaceae bacterium]|nr:CAP domain-containing protein [Polyangiaceae bacterium]
GASGAGVGGGSAGTAGSAGAAPTGGMCTSYAPGGTGSEAMGQIPLCCAPSAAEKELISEVFRLLNAHRMANGLPALAYDDKLEAAVQGHCRHMAEHTFFAHEAPEAVVTSPWDRAEACGAAANGENIARGQRSAADVMAAWTTSEGHNRNMLGNFGRVGIGYVASGRYWGQLFGR